VVFLDELAKESKLNKVGSPQPVESKKPEPAEPKARTGSPFARVEPKAASDG